MRALPSSAAAAFATPQSRAVELIDLPGIYGLSARSLDERIAVDVIRGAQGEAFAPDALLVLIDAADLRTHLHLALQLKSLGRPMLLVLNMIDLAEGATAWSSTWRSLSSWSAFRW